MSSGKRHGFPRLYSADDQHSANAEEAQGRINKQAPLSKTRTSLSHQEPFDRRPFKERKAALNLMQLAQTADSPISSDMVQNLIGTLIVSPGSY